MKNRWTCAGDTCLKEGTTWSLGLAPDPDRKIALCDRHLSMLKRIFPNVKTEPIESQGTLAGWEQIQVKKSNPGGRFSPVKRRVGMKKK